MNFAIRLADIVNILQEEIEDALEDGQEESQKDALEDGLVDELHIDDSAAVRPGIDGRRVSGF